MKLVPATFLLLGAVFSLVPEARADLIFASTQAAPAAEAKNMREVVLRSASDFVGQPVTFLPLLDEPFINQIGGEATSGKGTVCVSGAYYGTLQLLDRRGALMDVDSLMRKLSVNRRFNFKEFASLGSGHYRMVPWMLSGNVFVANKKALPYLPRGADIDNLTYDQFKQWASNIKKATGESKVGFPAAQPTPTRPFGVQMSRFIQGFLFPSFTGGLVTKFRSRDAVKMWTELKELWQYVDPRSLEYTNMSEPLLKGDVWIAFDHVVRISPPLQKQPDDFVAFPPPSGPKGRGYMVHIIGLAIPKSCPDYKAAEQLVDYMTKPDTQLLTLQSIGFYPSVSGKDMEQRMSKGSQSIQRALHAQLRSQGGKLALVPSQLGARINEFNSLIFETFRKIVIENGNVGEVVISQGAALQKYMNEVKVPCWAPDVAAVAVGTGTVIITQSQQYCTVQ